MSPTTGHPIPAPPTRSRKRKSPPQPRSGVISARQPVAAEASRTAPAAPAPKPVRKRTNVADLVKRIQDMEDALAQVVCGHEARLDALEIKMTGLINRVHASTDSVTLDDMTGVCRRLDALEAAGEVGRVMAQPHPVLVQAVNKPRHEDAKPTQAAKEPTMSQSIKETAVPSAVKAYANHLIWAAVLIASLLIWAVASNRGGLEPKYVTAKVNAAGMLMGQVEDGTWTFLGQIDRDSARRAEWQAGFRRGHGFGEIYGYDSAIKRIHDSLSRIPKPRKATWADFETDAERARRLDSAARMGKRGPL